jgi:ribonuclease D
MTTVPEPGEGRSGTGAPGAAGAPGGAGADASGGDRAAVSVAPPPLPRVIVDQAEFEALVEQLRDEPRYALDTEFHRERTYFPKLALLQLAWGDSVAVVDPLAVDVAPLAAILTGPATALLHAASQDLEVLDLSCGAVPGDLFDTQIAAGFLGMSSPSLSELHERQLGKVLTKGDRLTDWLRRPLTAEQLRYAASDVADLLRLHDQLTAQLERRGRLSWALDECANLLAKARGGRNPELAYLRIKEVRQLRGRAVGVARAVAAWRERRAATLDMPTRHVLPDLAVAGIAQRAPATLSELRKIRGIDDRHLRPPVADDLLEAVRAGRSGPAPLARPAGRTEVPREYRPAVGLLAAWVGQLARNLEIDSTLLATRADLEDLLKDDPAARLGQGWRAELVGAQVRELLAGRAALAFEGQGGLVLERRSHDTL